MDTFFDALCLTYALAANTLAAYRRDLTSFARWFNSQTGKQIDLAHASDIQDWFAARHATSKATTANRRLAALTRYFLWALRQEIGRASCRERVCQYV